MNHQMKTAQCDNMGSRSSQQPYLWLLKWLEVESWLCRKPSTILVMFVSIDSVLVRVSFISFFFHRMDWFGFADYILPECRVQRFKIGRLLGHDRRALPPISSIHEKSVSDYCFSHSWSVGRVSLISIINIS